MAEQHIFLFLTINQSTGVAFIYQLLMPLLVELQSLADIEAARNGDESLSIFWLI